MHAVPHLSDKNVLYWVESSKNLLGSDWTNQNEAQILHTIVATMVVEYTCVCACTAQIGKLAACLALLKNKKEKPMKLVLTYDL
jgi:hypothetical protein